MTATIDVDVDRPRTAPATAARVRAKNNKLCAEVTARLDTMPTDMVSALAIVVLQEFYRRKAAQQ